MSALTEKIVEISRAHPEMVSREIAAQLGCRDAYVRAVWQAHGVKRSTKHRGSDESRLIPRRVSLTKDTYGRFYQEAERRGVTVGAVLNAVLDTVAKDKLFRAVLDD